MGKFKYNDGDLVGPHQILMIKRTSKDFNNKWKGIFQCPYCKNTFESRINSVQSGLTQSCGCWNKTQQRKNGRKAGLKYGGQKYKDLTNKVFGYLTAVEIIGKTSSKKNIWKCLCQCGKETNVVAGDLLSGRTTSCGCRVESLGEEKIRLILKQNNISFECQKRFDDCCNINPLPFDFYLPDYNCCIEYDGKQHFENNCGWGEKLQTIQFRDNIKNQYCKDNKIKLIRIPYYDYNLLNIEYLLNKIKEN